MLVVVCITIFSISTVSSFEFDNVKDYNEETRTATITNAFGLGSEIATIKLESELVVNVMWGKDRLVAEFTIDNKWDNYNDAFKDMEFYDLKKAGDEINRDFTYKYKQGDDWIEFEDLETLPEGVITIGIFTNVKPGDRIEWIPTLFGERIEEWAVWADSLEVGLMAWYSFDNSTQDIKTDSVRGLSNLTLETVDATIKFNSTCIVNGCVHTNGSAILNSTSTVFDSVGATKNISIVTWFYINGSLEANRHLYHKKGASTGNLAVVVSDTDDVKFNPGGGNQIYDHADPLNGTWYHLAVVYNGSAVLWYVNGTNYENDSIGNNIIAGSNTIIGSSFNDITIGWLGLIDEFALWNRTLSATEVETLYNGGSGLAYKDAGTSVVHNFPTANANQSIKSIELSCNSTAARGETLDVSKVLVYTSASALDSTNSIDISGATNTTTHSVTLAGGSDTYSWECIANGTSGASTGSSGNRTFNIINITEVASSFVANTTEGSTEYFQINVTTLSLQLSTAELIYNNTAYTGTFSLVSGSSNNYTISRNLEIPTITTHRNNTFYWSILMANGERFNSTTNLQNVTNLGIDDCSSQPLRIMNFSFFDEDNQFLMNASNYNTSINVDIDISPSGSTTPIIEFNKTYNQTSEAAVCMPTGILNSSTYRLDATIQYTATGYATEFYHIQNLELTNNSIPQQIDLYDLTDASTQEFKLTVRDDNFVLLADALVDISRQYVSEGVFKTVEIPKTSSDGEAIAHLVLSDEKYNFIIKKDGVVIFTKSNVVANCDDSSIGDCEIRLNAIVSSDDPTDWRTDEDVSYQIDFDESSRVVTATFTTLSGASSDMLLNVTKYDAWGNDTVCSHALSSASGTLTCTIPQSYGNVTVVAVLTKDNAFIDRQVNSVSPNASDLYGGTGIMLVILMYMTITLMFIPHPVTMVIGAMSGITMALILNLYEGGSIFSTGSTIMWLIIASGVLIWQITQRSKSGV